MTALPPEAREKNKQIGDIGNYYGCLEIVKFDGKFYWTIENWDGCRYEEIPEYLYDALIKFESEN